MTPVLAAVTSACHKLSECLRWILVFDNTDEKMFDTKKAALEDLDFLGQDLLQKTKPAHQVLPTVYVYSSAIWRLCPQCLHTHDSSMNLLSKD